MPTIHDVARRAGVSSITVSRTINNSGPVSDATRARVEAAIAELNYAPNRLASGLRSKRTQTLALVVTDITNPFFTTLARGVEDVASEAGYSVIFCNTDESPEKERKYLAILFQQQVAGVLLVPARSSADPVRFIQERGTAVVVLDRRVPGVAVSVVRCDSTAGARQLVALLLELGHRRIAILNGPPGVSTADDRLAGYLQAMQEAGADTAGLVYSGTFTHDSGYEMAGRTIAVSPRPTALFAANNFIATGVLRAVRDRGLRVPEDIAIVCFDELPANLVSHPFFTTIAQPAYALGQQAAKLLIEQLDGDAATHVQDIILPAELIVRESSGKPINRS